jgi:tRNA/rRNA methyltransferase
VLDGAGAQKLRDLLAEHGAGRAPSERTPLRGLPRLLRRNPTDAERALWQALVNDRRFAGRGYKRQVPIGPHIADFVSFPLKCVIDLVPATENEAPARAEKRAWLEAHEYRVVEVKAADVEADVARVLNELAVSAL